jgi:hypothetical protein
MGTPENWGQHSCLFHSYDPVAVRHLKIIFLPYAGDTYCCSIGAVGWATEVLVDDVHLVEVGISVGLVVTTCYLAATTSQSAVGFGVGMSRRKLPP